MYDTRREYDVDKALIAQQREIDKINTMTHEELARLWRSAADGHPYFDNTLPYYKVFKERLFNHFGGFTPEISKKIGWRK